MTTSNFDKDRAALANTMLRMANLLASVTITAAPPGPSAKEAMQNDPQMAKDAQNAQTLAPMVEALQKFPDHLNKSLSDFITKYGKQVQDVYGVNFVESAKAFIADFQKNMDEFTKALQGQQTKFSKKSKVAFRENVELPQ